jgi:hypothetical protein
MNTDQESNNTVRALSDVRLAALGLDVTAAERYPEKRSRNRLLGD